MALMGKGPVSRAIPTSHGEDMGGGRETPGGFYIHGVAAWLAPVRLVH